ncbi:MAG: S66 peptidase family protein [Chitinophagaceae bacterium]
MIIPPYLKKGNTIGIVCTSGYMPLENTKTCVSVLKKAGYNVVLGKTVGNQNNYFSGTDEERLNDLQTMLDDDSIFAILCGRGGYGLSRIFKKINFKKFIKSPKWIIGFSDITVLHSYINAQIKIATLHAPMVNAFNNDGYKNKYVQSLLNAIKGPSSPYYCLPHVFNKVGDITAELVGGNLCILAHLQGTTAAAKTKGKILFLEDVGEYLYNIDRMFLQLKHGGVFKDLAGLIIGGFTELKDTTIPFGQTVYEIIHSHISEYNFPVCFNFPVSHDVENVALKIGVTYQLKITKNNVILKEVT